MKFIFILLSLLQFTFSQNTISVQTPIDIETQIILVKSFALKQMGIDSFSNGELLRIDYSGQDLEISSKSFKEFNRAASIIFPKENFIINRYKQRIDIYCKQDYNLKSVENFIPEFVINQKEINSINKIKIKYSKISDVKLMNKFLMLFSKRIIHKNSIFTYLDSIIVEIPKIKHNVSIAKAKLSSSYSGDIALPSPIFTIDAIDHLGNENFTIELNLKDKSQLHWISYKPVAGEDFQINNNNIQITIAPELISSDSYVTLGDLIIEVGDWEGFLPLNAVIKRNEWKKKIDLSKKIEFGKIDMVLERPAIIHPELKVKSNHSIINLEIGSQNSLLDKGDSFELILIDAFKTKFEREYPPDLESLSEDYKINVIDNKRCEIILLKDPRRNSIIKIKELPINVSSNQARSDILIKYPNNMMPSDTLYSVIVIPKIDTLHYHENTIELPLMPLSDLSNQKPSYAYLLNDEDQPINLLQKINRIEPFYIPKIDLSLEKKDRATSYFDYLFKYTSGFYARRKVVIAGKINIKYVESSSQFPWRLLNSGEKPQKLPSIQISDDKNILQRGDSIIFYLPPNNDLFFNKGNIDNQSISLDGKSVIIRYQGVKSRELTLPEVIVSDHRSSTFSITTEIRALLWRKKISMEGTIKIGSPDITLGPTNSLVLFRDRNKIPSILISDPHNFLEAGDSLLFDFYYNDGSIIDYLAFDSDLENSIIKDKIIPNRIVLPIIKSSQIKDGLTINSLMTGVVTEGKNKKVLLEVGINYFNNRIEAFDDVLHAVDPKINFHRKSDGFWVANDGGIKDIVLIELREDSTLSAFNDDSSYVNISLPLQSGAKWSVGKGRVISASSNNNLLSGIHYEYNGEEQIRINFSKNDIINGKLFLGEYGILPKERMSSEFNFEYSFKDVSKAKKSKNIFKFYKPKLLITKDNDQKIRNNIYVHQNDSIKISLPLISYIEKSDPLLNAGDRISLKWSNPDWNWDILGKYDNKILKLISSVDNIDEIAFELTEDLRRGQSLDFKNFNILYNGRSINNVDSLIISISKNNNDYLITSPTKIISSNHEINVRPQELIWSRDQIRTPSFTIKGSSRPVGSPQRKIIIRLRSSHGTQPHWKTNYTNENKIYSANANKENPELLYIELKSELDIESEILIPSIPLENLDKDLGDIFAEFSYDGGENYAVTKTLIHLVQPKEISSLTDWKLIQSNFPQPLNKIKITNGSEYNSFYKGDTLSIILPGKKSIRFSNELKKKTILLGSAKEKIGPPIISSDNAKIFFPILESFELEDALSINGLWLRTTEDNRTKRFSLQYLIRPNSGTATKDQTFYDQNEITVSNIDIKVDQSKKIYSLLDSVFQVPRIQLIDDSQIPFIDKGDRLVFRFNKPPGYKLVFKRNDFSDNVLYDTQIMSGKDLEIFINNDLNSNLIDLSQLFLEKPTIPMGLHTLECEVIKAGLSKDNNRFLFNIPLKIAFSNDIPSFRMVDDKEFLVNNRSTLLPELIIEEDSLLQTIKKGSTILIELPDGFKAAWNKKSINKIRLTGSAAKKVNRIEYKNEKTLKIQIINNFKTNDQLKVEGLELFEIRGVMKEGKYLSISYNNNKNIVKILKPSKGAKGKISSGQIKLIWARQQTIVPNDINDSERFDPIRIVRNSKEQLNYFGIDQLYFYLEPISEITDAAEWESKMKNFGKYKFQNEIFSLKSINKQVLTIQLNDSELAQNRLAFNELSIPGLWLGEFKRNRNGQYKLSMRIEKNGPTIAKSNHIIDIDWNGQPSQPLENPFNKNKIVKLSGITQGEFVDIIETKIIVNKEEASKHAYIFRNDKLDLELNRTIKKGSSALIQNIAIEIKSSDNNQIKILPQIEIDNGYGFESFPSYQELIIDMVNDTIITKKSKVERKSSENIKDIYVSNEYKEGNKVVFDLEFNVVSDRTPENINIENRREEIFTRLFLKGIPAIIEDVISNFISNDDYDLLIKKAYSIRPGRWEHYYLRSLISHYADNVDATELYKKAIELGYSAKHYETWPQNPNRDSDQNVVEGRLMQVIELTKLIPANYFSLERTKLSESVYEKIELADDIFLKVQEIDGWQKYEKNNSNNPNMDIDRFIAEVDLALGLGDLTKASDLLKGLNIKSDRSRRTNLRSLHRRITKDKSYKNRIMLREEKIDWENKNQKTFEKADYSNKIFLSQQKNPYLIDLIDNTGEEVKFRIISSNDRQFDNKGLKVRKGNYSHTFYGEGIYTIDPEAEKDEKNINLLNIIFSIMTIGVLVLI